MSQIPTMRRVAAGNNANVVGRPAQKTQRTAAIADNDPLYSEAQLNAPTVRVYVGTVKQVTESIVQMFVKQRGGQLRLQDFPANSALAIVYGSEPNTDQLYMESSVGQVLSKLILTGYEGNYTVFQDQKGQKVLIRSNRALVQSDKRQPDVFGVTTGNKASAGTGAPRGRRPTQTA